MTTAYKNQEPGDMHWFETSSRKQDVNWVAVFTFLFDRNALQVFSWYQFNANE